VISWINSVYDHPVFFNFGHISPCIFNLCHFWPLQPLKSFYAGTNGSRMMNMCSVEGIRLEIERMRAVVLEIKVRDLIR
jgi:hypothetical protein